MYATLRAMLQSAKIHDGLLLANPAEKLGRELCLTTTAKVREAEVKAMDHGQVDTFLKASHEVSPRHAPLFFLLARSGLMIGEALALKWDDVNLDRREITVERTLSVQEGTEGEPVTGTTKGGRSRRVDASKQLCAVLRSLEVQRKAETLQGGWGKVPEWVFCSETGQPIDPSKVGKVFRKVQEKAEIRGRFSVHSLRHSSKPSAPARPVARIRSEATRPRIHSVDRGHLRPLAADGEQGRRGPSRRGGGDREIGRCERTVKERPVGR
ncbi:MAG: tyrosine-type recombinase/integrase [Candidatus Polarisedimenticolia bacterium]